MKGIATTTKNRFKEKHMDFDVFAAPDKLKAQKPKKKDEDKNLDQGFDNTL
jgi:hypothetical protein